MNFKKPLIIALSLLAVATTSILIANAAKNNSSINKQSIDTNKIKQVLKENLGINSAIKVNPSPIDGLFEVVVDNQIIYANKDASYVVIGTILDTKNKANLTQNRMENLQAIKWQDLPLANAMTWQKGNISKTPHRQIAVFADPNCGYCKKMEQELQKINNLTVYTFILPILSPDSMQKGVDIWCQKSAVNVWRDWMLNHKTPPKAISNCKNPLQANVNFAQKFGIHGTPAVFFTDGSRVSGVMEAKDLEAKFSQLVKK